MVTFDQLMSQRQVKVRLFFITSHSNKQTKNIYISFFYFFAFEFPWSCLRHRAAAEGPSSIYLTFSLGFSLTFFCLWVGTFHIQLPHTHPLIHLNAFALLFDCKMSASVGTCRLVLTEWQSQPPRPPPPPFVSFLTHSDY